MYGNVYVVDKLMLLLVRGFIGCIFDIWIRSYYKWMLLLIRGFMILWNYKLRILFINLVVIKY